MMDRSSLLEMARSYQPAAVSAAAADLDLFSALSKGPLSAEAVTRQGGEAERLRGRAVRCGERAEVAEEGAGAPLNHFSAALSGLGVLVDG
jgi:hypothetical protein